MPFADERVKPSRYRAIRWFGLDRFEPERAVTSYWIPSTWFFVIRFICCIYSTAVMWGSIAQAAINHSFRTYFAYFTHLTFIGLHAYLVTATYHHARYLMQSPRRPSSFFNQPSFLNYLFVYLYHTIVVFNIITPVVYWAALSGDLRRASGLEGSGGGSGEPPLNWWTSVSMHGVSFLLMFADENLSRMKMNATMCIPMLFTVILYMFLTFIVYARDNWWVYPFLRWSQGGIAAAWYIGVGAAFVVVYFIQYGYHRLRSWVAKKLHRGEAHERQPDMEETCT